MSRLFHGMVGVCTEAGELQDMVKKHVIYGKPFDRLNIKEELGDILWYVALAADAYGFTLDEIMQRNIDKLEARYKGKFTEQAALDRDLGSERIALEGPNILIGCRQTSDPIDVARTIPERVIPSVEPRQWDILREDAPSNWNGTISLGEVSQEIFDLLSQSVD